MPQVRLRKVTRWSDQIQRLLTVRGYCRKGSGSGLQTLIWRPCRRQEFRSSGRSGLGAGPCGGAVEPGLHVGVGRVQRLSDGGAEREEAVEQNVGQREPIAAQPGLAGELPVEPAQ